MNQIYDKSKIIPLADLDIFSTPPTQLSIINKYTTEHRPLAPLSSDTEIQFEFSSSIDEYIELRDMMFYIKLKIDLNKTGNVTEDDWKTFSPVNNLMHSLFKTVEMEINGKNLDLSPQSYSYKAYFESELGYTFDAQTSHLNSVGWFDDIDYKEAISENSITKSIRPTTINTDGTGIIKEYMGKLYIPICQQPKSLIGGLKCRVRLIPNDPSFYIWSTVANVRANIHVEQAKLFVSRSKVIPEIVEAHNRILLKNNAKYPINRTYVKSHTITQGSSDVSIDNIINGQIPNRILIAFVPNSAFSGAIDKNPYNFKHYNINYLSLHVNGIQYPVVAYTPNFENNLYVREYLSMFEAFDQLSTDSVINISKKYYHKGNTIFGFNLSQDASNDIHKSGYFNAKKFGEVGIKVKFATAPTENIEMIIYCEFNNMIEINSNREIITDYM